MKMNKFLLSLVGFPLFCGAKPCELDLAGAWQLACTTNETISCGITVPGDVHSAMRRMRSSRAGTRSVPSSGVLVDVTDAATLKARLSVTSLSGVTKM